MVGKYRCDEIKSVLIVVLIPGLYTLQLSISLIVLNFVQSDTGELLFKYLKKYLSGEI